MMTLTMIVSASESSVDRLQQRADEGWKAAELERLTLHDCRHTFASVAIGRAGVNAKALSTDT